VSKKFDVTKAASWTQEETDEAIEYFTTRSNYYQLDRIAQFRGEAASPEPESQPGPSGEIDLDDATVEQVLEWVGEDKGRAQVALDKENEFEKPRKTLVEPLEELLTS
jgi:hypothetical protein